MKYIVYSELDAGQRSALIRRPASCEQEAIAGQVAAVEQELLSGGDAALQQFCLRFDGVVLEPQQFRVAPQFWCEAWQSLDPELQAALETALHNIACFHRSELPEAQRAEPTVETSLGVHCWREFRAIESVGLYIPGGSAPLFSTMLMLGVPAIIAGCRRIVFCSPPVNPDNLGKGNLGNSAQSVPYAPGNGVYAAAEMLGCMDLLSRFATECAAAKMKSETGKGIADQIPVQITVQDSPLLPIPKLEYFQLGGAQAIFGLAYGPEANCSLPSVDKIFGPGNSYVTEAKLLVSRRVAIDMPAGPSEVLVLAESGQNPVIIAADLLAQAEHGPSSQVLMASPSSKLLRQVEQELARQAAELPRSSEVQGALANSYLIETEDLQQALAFSNDYAPEHLILAVDDYKALLPQIINAGSVFCGPHASESFGDYASGTNHTLPTSGFARSFSGVNTQSFGRWLSFQSVNEEGLRKLGPKVQLLAEKEQLLAHKNAVTVRLKHLQSRQTSKITSEI